MGKTLGSLSWKAVRVSQFPKATKNQAYFDFAAEPKTLAAQL